MHDHLQKIEQISVYGIYILFAFGGLWHVLDVFQPLMRFLASPLLILVSLLLFYTAYKSVVHSFRIRFFVWFLVILMTGWGVEYGGVETHFPFGNYRYGPVLQPQVLDIPLAIAFAWFNICFSSLLIAYAIIRYVHLNKAYQTFLLPFISAVFMLFFDFVMEQAAPQLDYWSWQGGDVPIKNYVSWFLLGYGFSFLFQQLRISLMRYPILGMHAYIAQLLYFIPVILKP